MRLSLSYLGNNVLNAETSLPEVLGLRSAIDKKASCKSVCPATNPNGHFSTSCCRMNTYIFDVLMLVSCAVLVLPTLLELPPLVDATRVSE